MILLPVASYQLQVSSFVPVNFKSSNMKPITATYLCSFTKQESLDTICEIRFT